MNTEAIPASSPIIEIHQQDLQRALRSMIYNTSNRPNPLENLLIVQQARADAGNFRFQHENRFALQGLLVDMITNAYRRHRELLGLLIPKIDADEKSSRLTILNDIQTGNPEMIGWSWLYHRFVRVELNITGSDFCGRTGVERRTLHRYQNHSVQRLLGLLRISEYVAWQTPAEL